MPYLDTSKPIKVWYSLVSKYGPVYFLFVLVRLTINKLILKTISCHTVENSELPFNEGDE